MSTKIVNYYDHIPKNNSTLYNYDMENKLQIKIPFRMLLCGPSGSGKTSLLLNFLKMINIFDKIILLAKDLDEPLYKHLITTYEKIEVKLKCKILLAIDSVKDLPTPEDCDARENTLLICDDLICESKKDLAKLGSFWIRARKRSVSMIFLSQAYYGIPKIIRENSSYVCIKKVSTPKDLKRMLKEYELGVTIDELQKMYAHALSGDKLLRV